MTASPLTLPEMPRSTPDLLELAGARAAASDELEAKTDELVKAIAKAIREGREPNISAIAARAKIARQTIYTRLDELGVSR